ncbi:MAG TPA: type I DNA topoisomerase [Gaiellaceae bacterium]|nr:type I DNA topoisomerase [Gaiellaceae bacterium]
MATTEKSGGNRLVIVESPAKARTISGYLGDGFTVASSVGHIRDLPSRASEIPKEKRAKYGTMGVAIDDEFEPLYLVDKDKKRTVDDLKKQLKQADELLLATDEDREGEAIAWHLKEVLKPKVPVHRMVFHEITRDAIERSLGQMREIDDRLVDAQETRRILDRLYGFEVSPVLWKKVTQGLSAGRVQSVATRLVVERERERIAFVDVSYWDLEGIFDPGSFTARLVALDGKRVARGSDFGADGKLKNPEIAHLDESAARGLLERLADATFSVRSKDEKPYTRRPTAPFRTATLQQEASRKLRYSSQTTMRVAQRLYENGYITYMRTDSTSLSEAAVAAARRQVTELYGADYLPPKPRSYERKVKNAQEAHEAIRPAGDRFRTPTEVRGELNRDELALYELIWKRTISSQMADARGQTVSLRLGAASSSGEDVEFGASGTVITFPGFLAAYEVGKDDEDDEENRPLPNLEEGQGLETRELTAQGHATSPPPRYTEATLVRALEERGIGRPSTYAAIMGTILDRGYVFKRGTALVPSFLAFSVVELLEKHFGRLVDYEFTARMEDDLDRIAAGDEGRVDWLRRFYFGENDGGEHEAGLKELVTALGEIDARAVNTFPIDEDIAVRVGRYGPYVERGEERASVPLDLAPDELTLEKAKELLAQPSGDRELGIHPETGRQLVAKTGRFGPYVTEVLPEDDKSKPKTASLFKSMSLDTVTLDDAVKLLSLPRVLGPDPTDGEDVEALNGRYGPYVKKGTETRSLESEEQLFTVTLDEALELLRKPKERRRRGAAAGPLREVGVDPTTTKKIVIRNGRFGPYVTDGETNASLKAGDEVDSLSFERALELLADRRARGPAPRGRRRTRA